MRIILINKTCKSHKIVFVTEINSKDIQKSNSKLPQKEPAKLTGHVPKPRHPVVSLLWAWYSFCNERWMNVFCSLMQQAVILQYCFDMAYFFPNLELTCKNVLPKFTRSVWMQHSPNTRRSSSAVVTVSPSDCSQTVNCHVAISLMNSWNVQLLHTDPGGRASRGLLLLL